jgi:hypothetical protein
MHPMFAGLFMKPDELLEAGASRRRRPRDSGRMSGVAEQAKEIIR